MKTTEKADMAAHNRNPGMWEMEEGRLQIQSPGCAVTPPTSEKGNPHDNVKDTCLYGHKDKTTVRRQITQRAAALVMSSTVLKSSGD